MLSLVEVFDGHARALSGHQAVCCLGDDGLSWGKLREVSVAIAKQITAQLATADKPVELIAILAKRSPLWLASTVAVLRCGFPFVWMGAGELPSRSRPVELARNVAILRALKPGLVLMTGEELPDVVPDWGICDHRPQVMTVSMAASAGPMADLAAATPRETLCYMLTGGTTGASKCVKVTHAMALHEAAAYPKVAPRLGSQDRLLQHTAVLWAASALGQLDIALAFGSTICISTSADQETIAAHRASILGIVPSALDSLDPHSVPSVRCVFTWGEALSRVLAERWRKGAMIPIFELLISTEYWLSFVCTGAVSSRGRSLYHPVDRVEFGVLPVGHEHLRTDVGASGELCIRGPMVMQGYLKPDEERDGSFWSVAGEALPYFRTRDVVTLVRNHDGSVSIEFCGRNDQLVKVAGQFVDLSEAEQRLAGACGHDAEVSVVPRPAQVEEHGMPANGAAPAHAFIAVSKPKEMTAARALSLLKAVRSALPRGAALHLVKAPLPRDPVTGKVDRRSLLAGLQGLSPALPSRPALMERLKPYPGWLLATALVAIVDLPRVFEAIVNVGLPRERLTPTLLRLLFHLVSAPYLWLFSMYLPKRALRKVTNHVPFGRLGIIALLHHLDRRRQVGSARGFRQTLALSMTRSARAILVLGAVLGAALAHQRGRLASWWVAFWLAIPEHAEAESGWWLKLGSWAWYADQILGSPWHCLSFGEWLLELAAGSPTQARKVWQHLQDLRRPYQIPAALVYTPREAPPRAGISATPQRLDSPIRVSQPGSAQAPACSEPSLETTGSTSLSVEIPCEVGPAAADVDSSEESAEQVEPTPPEHAESPPAELVVSAEPCPVPPSPSWQCEGCQTELSWGMDWRTEGDACYCKECHRNFDNQWWEKVTKDVIDGRGISMPVIEPLGKEATECIGPLAQALLRLLAPLVGNNEPFAASSLAGIDSLAVLTLCRQLRLAVPGLLLKPQMVFECSTVGDLLALVESLERSMPSSAATIPGERNGKGSSLEKHERMIWFAPGQYTGTCKWMYGCRGLLDETAFRTAAARLIARHEGLHAGFSDSAEVGMDLIRFLKEFLTVHATFWPYVENKLKELHPRLQSLIRPGLQALRNCATWALKGSWPRSAPMKITSDFLDQRVQVFYCQSWRDVDEQSQQFRNSFTPPVMMALYLLERPPYLPRVKDVFGPGDLPHEWGAPTSFVQFIVSHAYSDGFTSVPLISDFASLLGELEGRRNDGSSVSALPYGKTFEILEERFFAAVDGQPHWANPDQMSLRATGFDGPWVPRRQPWVYNHEVLVERNAVESLRLSAKRYGIPFDVTLLAVVLSATFRAAADLGLKLIPNSVNNDTTRTSDVMSLPLTLYVPMRDGDLNDAMVGLFSDWRDVTVPCSDRSTLLGLCLDVAETIRYRRWNAFDPIQNSERILVNILPLDEQARGAQHFRQTRAHEYGGRRTSSSRERRASKQAHRPMRVTLEQEAPDAWWLSLDINADHFSTSWCRGFVRSFERCLEELASRPLTPVLERKVPPRGAIGGKF